MVEENYKYSRLVDNLITDEGFRQFPYDDATGKPVKAPEGKITIGHGINLEDRGIKEDESLWIMKNVISDREKSMRNIFTEQWDNLSLVRRSTLLNMAYHMGMGSFLKFKKMIKAIKEQDFERAGDEMKDSRWYRNFPTRVTPLIRQMKDDEWYT